MMRYYLIYVNVYTHTYIQVLINLYVLNSVNILMNFVIILFILFEGIAK